MWCRQDGRAFWGSCVHVGQRSSGKPQTEGAGGKGPLAVRWTGASTGTRGDRPPSPTSFVSGRALHGTLKGPYPVDALAIGLADYVQPSLPNPCCDAEALLELAGISP